MTFNMNDLMEALATANTAPKDARTAQQMADELGVPRCTVAKALRALGQQKRVTCHRVPLVGVDGRNVMVPAYVILPPR
jgi:DNA-binding transcriptional regulator YhcF (GntR family)